MPDLFAKPGETYTQYEERLGFPQGGKPQPTAPGLPPSNAPTTPTGLSSIAQQPPQGQQTPPVPSIFGANPPTGAPSIFQGYLQTAIDRLNANNDLLKQKNLLVKHLYDTPLSEQEVSTLAQPIQDAIKTGDRHEIELQMRLLNDNIAGRQNTLNSSVDFLTKAYEASLNELDKKRTDATNVVKEFITQYGSQAKNALLSLYGPERVQELQIASGINLDKVGALPKTLAEQKLSKTGTSGGSGATSGVYKTDLDALVGNTMNLIQSQNGKVAFANSIKNSRNESDKINAIASVVLRNSPNTVRVDFVNQTQGISSIDKAIKLLDSGVQTGVINSAKQYTYNILGKDFDPKLAAINSYIVSAIQPYRNSVTGAAWGAKEDREYEQLFGSTKYSPEELKNRLLRIKEIMTDKSTAALGSQVSPFGDNPFQQSSDPWSDLQDDLVKLRSKYTIPEAVIPELVRLYPELPKDQIRSKVKDFYSKNK